MESIVCECGQEKFSRNGGNYCPRCESEMFVGVSLEPAVEVVKSKTASVTPVFVDDDQEDEV